MAKDPAFLFYSSDFLIGVADLNFEERGKYITLLCLQHQKGPLSSKVIGMTVGVISEDLRKKFSVDGDGNLFNERLLDESTKRNNYTESRRNNARKPKAYATAKNEHKENEDVNRNENIIEDVNTTPFQKKVAEFFNYRKEIKKPIREASKDAFLKSLTKLSGGDEIAAIAILDQSIANGWQGIFALKQNYGQTITKNGNGHNNGNIAGSSTLLERSREVLRQTGNHFGGTGNNHTNTDISRDQ